MSNQIDKLVKLYKTLSNTPVLTGGRISKTGLFVHTNWTHRCIEKGKYVKYSKMNVINDSLEPVFSTHPFNTTNEVISAICPSEKYRAVIREINDSKDDRKQFLEVWSSNHLQNVVDLTTLDIHGNVYSDHDFGALRWSPDETKIIYIAEKKLAKREPFYKRKPEKSSNSSDGDSGPPPSKGEEYIYRQEWGEANVGKSQSVIAMYDLNQDTVRILEGIPDDLCPGQVIWTPDGQNIIGIVWDTEPRKLGIVYCTNRSSKLFALDLNGNYSELTASGRSVYYPLISPNGKYLVWLDGRVGGPHRSAMTLRKLENPFTCGSKGNIVIDVIETKITTTGGQPFYGLYNMALLQRCWAKDNYRIIFSTTQKNESKTYVLNLKTSDLTELEYDKGSQSVLDVYDDKILAHRRNYLHNDEVIIGILPKEGCEKDIVWKTISEPIIIKELENYTYHYMDISHDNDDSIKNFNVIYFGPKCGSDKSVPMIIAPHGGPHSSYFNAFTLESAMYASLGFALCFVNYRGSLGAGQKSIEFLLGRVGDTDVKDCVLAAEECCKQFPWINPNKLVLSGGSHGGFLVTHLSGQYPDMFKAVICRNPVIDIASMSITSDIPDWCATEAGSEFTQKGPVNDELLLKMRKSSPIEYAHQVKAPTFIMVGSKDLRVPSSQGIEFYHRLKANNIPVKMNLYDDNHPLGKVPNEMDNLINGILWFLEHTA